MVTTVRTAYLLHLVEVLVAVDAVDADVVKRVLQRNCHVEHRDEDDIQQQPHEQRKREAVRGSIVRCPARMLLSGGAGAVGELVRFARTRGHAWRCHQRKSSPKGPHEDWDHDGHAHPDHRPQGLRQPACARQHQSRQQVIIDGVASPTREL